jgi:hypothetical protein
MSTFDGKVTLDDEDRRVNSGSNPYPLTSALLVPNASSNIIPLYRWRHTKLLHQTGGSDYDPRKVASVIGRHRLTSTLLSTAKDDEGDYHRC